MDKFQAPYINSVETTPRNTTAATAFVAFSAQPDDILIVTHQIYY